ncbi:hypothetical protein [Pedobacter duraquae]|uniref:Uncharacterized protein n=1 Tax=Pedobacter duraquae TaxID=425511 RepID=A0A4R6IKY4_9SPHI|nr:hypothetical protein [Pedobacter duraquae]TDO22723.1 hypothetical protein CLV32_1704 [Pedobacter duraquae]
MKITLYLIVTVIALCLISFWYQVYIMGKYYMHAGLFLTIFGALAPVAVIYISYLSIRQIKRN